MHHSRGGSTILQFVALNMDKSCGDDNITSAQSEVGTEGCEKLTTGSGGGGGSASSGGSSCIETPTLRESTLC